MAFVHAPAFPQLPRVGRDCALVVHAVLALGVAPSPTSIALVTRSWFLILPFDLAFATLAISIATAGPGGCVRDRPAGRPGMP